MLTAIFDYFYDFLACLISPTNPTNHEKYWNEVFISTYSVQKHDTLSLYILSCIFNEKDYERGKNKSTTKTKKLHKIIHTTVSYYN